MNSAIPPDDGQPKTAIIQNVEASSLPTLVDAEEMSKRLLGYVSAERIRELAAAGYLPCWRIDGQEPRYRPPDVKAWVAQHLVVRQEGKDLPRTLRVVAEPCAVPVDLPAALAPLATTLLELPSWHSTPAVYFLLLRNEVVYVGQFITVLSRVASHRSEGRKAFDRVVYLPVDPEELVKVESAFIRLLKPRFNGYPSQADKSTDTDVLASLGFTAERSP